MNAPIRAAVLAPDYLAEAIADEATLAVLLGWTKLEVPTVTTKNPFLWGRPPSFMPDWPGASGRTFLPKWRRSWEGAGQLIGACNLSVSSGEVSARAGFGYGTGEVIEFVASYDEHPTPEDARHYAICRAAIAFLSAAKT